MNVDYTPDDDRRLAEWLGLDKQPHTYFVCPDCGSMHFGIVDAMDDNSPYACHDQFQFGCKWVGPESKCYHIHGYLTMPDPHSDYRVLEAVRKLPNLSICRVRDAVKATWDWRALDYDQSRELGQPLGVWGCTQYEPGDYARAAFAVMKEGE